MYSASTTALVLPATRRSTLGALTFPVAAVGLKFLAAQSLYGAIFVVIPAATEDPPFPPFLLF